MTQVLFDDNTLSSIKKYKDLFKEFMIDEQSELAFLYGLERLLSSKKKELITKIPASYNGYMNLI